ncbi:hypothetical protein [Altererythrobacter aquiaggeris]|uniref:hypothetical protein n=1 Tax=Aestuarierythrobacter aquiaggeris TaxID=1898396 RepID=UPI003016EAFC
MSRLPSEFLNDELFGRAMALNDAPIDIGGKYVLVWLQQTLRGHDHPTIDAGVQIANELGIPALV